MRKLTPPPYSPFKLLSALIIPLLLLASTLVAGSASAAECVAWDPASPVCDSSVQSHILSQTDVPAEYRGFVLNMEKYDARNAVYDSNWKENTNTGVDDVSKEMMPTKIGAAVKLPKVGLWVDSQGDFHSIDAKFTVTGANGGATFAWNGIFAVTNSIHTTNGTDGVYPLKINWSKRLGLEFRLDFTYTDNGKPVPDTFKGVTGLGDLDYNNGNGTGSNPGEGVELLSGFDGAWTVANPHLKRYGDNGWAGTDDNLNQTDLTSTHAQQHIISATFSGPSISIRYSTYKMYGYATIFSTPLTQSRLDYKITYNGNGATGGNTTATNGKAGDVVTVAENGFTWNDGGDGVLRRFTGWNTAKDGSGVSFTPGQNTPIVANMTLYAQWSPLYKLAYNQNEGIGSLPAD